MRLDERTRYAYVYGVAQEFIDERYPHESSFVRPLWERFVQLQRETPKQAGAAGLGISGDEEADWTTPLVFYLLGRFFANLDTGMPCPTLTQLAASVRTLATMLKVPQDKTEAMVESLPPELFDVWQREHTASKSETDVLFVERFPSEDCEHGDKDKPEQIKKADRHLVVEAAQSRAATIIVDEVAWTISTRQENGKYSPRSLCECTRRHQVPLWLALTKVGEFFTLDHILDLGRRKKRSTPNAAEKSVEAFRDFVGKEWSYKIVQGRDANRYHLKRWSFCWIRYDKDPRDSHLLDGPRRPGEKQ